MQIIDAAGTFSAAGQDADWREHLRVADLSIGTYSIPAGGRDEQEPHTEDEIYVVMSGRAVITAGPSSAPVAAGSVIYVPAGEEHRFTQVSEDLTVLVCFVPAEYSRSKS